MNANAIATTIRKLMPLINDYMDLYEYERQALTQAADLITSQRAEIDRLTAMNKEAVELLGLAVGDMRHCGICEYCLNQNTNEDCDCECDECKNRCLCRECNQNASWQWQHADRYEAIKKRMEEPSHDLQ